MISEVDYFVVDYWDIFGVDCDHGVDVAVDADGMGTFVYTRCRVRFRKGIMFRWGWMELSM